MKKSVLFFLFILLLLGEASPFAKGALFKDVPKSHRFHGEIKALVETGVVSGYEGGRFKPDQPVTRAQAAVMIGRALQLNGTSRKKPFSDVDAKTSTAGFIYTASKLKIINGFPDGTFQPDETVTRGQMAILLTRAFRLAEASPIAFRDVSPSAKAHPYVSRIVAAGITEGYHDDTFRLSEKVTRGQFAAFMARALGLRSKPIVPTWSGSWNNKDGTVKISNETTSSFFFHLTASAGGQTSKLKGIAEFKAGKGVYRKRIPLFQETCELVFTKHKTSITVTESSACSYWHSAAAAFSGTYSK